MKAAELVEAIWRGQRVHYRGDKRSSVWLTVPERFIVEIDPALVKKALKHGWIMRIEDSNYVTTHKGWKKINKREQKRRKKGRG